MVPTKSKAKSLAYDFIDITMQPEIQNLLGNNGGVPVAADPAQITDAEEQGAHRQLQPRSRRATAWRSTRTGPRPATTTCMVGGVQGLINGSKTPAQLLDEIAKPYNDNLADLGK